jgi:uncharacterized protein YceK
MKKLLIALACILLISGCSYTQSDDSSQEVESTEEDITIQTKYYQVKIPAEWKDLCEYDVVDLETTLYALDFYEKESLEAMDTGFLFGIVLYEKESDYKDLPSYEKIGELTVDNQTYHVIVEEPTDVQFTDDASKNYHMLLNGEKTVLDSIQANEGYTYTKEK